MKFLEKFPGRVDRLIFLGAPRHDPGTLLTILDRVIPEFPQQIEVAKGSNPEIVGQFEQSFRHAQELRTGMFNGEGDPISETFTAQNINFIFVLAMNFGLYAPSQPSDQAKNSIKRSLPNPNPRSAANFSVGSKTETTPSSISRRASHRITKKFTEFMVKRTVCLPKPKTNGFANSSVKPTTPSFLRPLTTPLSISKTRLSNN